MSQFAKLLEELQATAAEQETLVKSLPAEDGEDDEAIQAAAADGEDANPEDEADEADEEADKDAPAFGKSMTAMVDGEEVEAIDATDLLKSLQGRLDTTESVLAKGLETALGTIKSQGEMIKSLNERLNKLAGTGKGRKTVLAITEKPAAGEQALVKSQDGLSPQEFLAKANAAFAAGKLTGQELTTADVAIRMGQQIPAGIIAKALS